MESLWHLFEGLDSFWHLRWLEIVPTCNYVVEASIPTIILFCVICKDVDNLYKWQTFRPKSLHQSQILHVHVKSGSAEGLWTETSPIHINYQHLCGLHKKELSLKRLPWVHNCHIAVRVTLDIYIIRHDSQPSLAVWNLAVWFKTGWPDFMIGIR